MSEIPRSEYDLPDVEPADPAVVPTPEQWVYWFRTQPTEGQIRVAKLIQENAVIAGRCEFTEDHAGQIEFLKQRDRRHRDAMEHAIALLQHPVSYLEGAEVSQQLSAFRDRLAQVAAYLKENR